VQTELRSEADHKNPIEMGFTLVELLIVIVILGILAGIVVFAVGNLTSNAANHACATEMNTFETAVQSWYAQNPGGTLAQNATKNPQNANGYAPTLNTSNLLASSTVAYYGDGNATKDNTHYASSNAYSSWWSYTAGAAGVPGTVAAGGTCQ
jgi:prepilin-type N-terminal cleavage/methylation domain-containing protein